MASLALLGVVGLALGLGVLGGFWIALTQAGGHAGLAALGAVAGLGGAVTLALAVRTIVDTTPGRLVGAELTREQHPRLWNEVEEIAGRLGTRPPARIVSDGTVNAALTDQGEMVIGLPLLVGLDRDELRAVLAHELAHHVTGTPPIVARVYRTTRRLEQTTAAVRPGVAKWLLTEVSRSYLALAHGPDRDHERQADDHAARIAGPGVTASALLRVAKLHAAWHLLVETYLPLSGPARRRPSLADGLRSILAARPGELSAAPPPPPASGFDAHPPTAARVGRLSALPAGAPRARTVPATTLLGARADPGEDDALAQLERSVLVDDDPPATWAEVAALAGSAEQERVAAVLARAALAAGVPEPVTPALLLDAFGRGEGPRIVDALLPPGLDASERRDATKALLKEFLAALVAVTLLRPGLARFRLDWAGPSRLERRDPAGGWTAWDGGQLVSDAAGSPGAVTPLRAWLTHLRADLGTPIEAAPEPPPRLLSAFADSEVLGPFGSRPVDVVVWTTGVLLAPAPAATALNRLRGRVGGGTARVAAGRIVALADAAGADPESVPGGWWIPAATVSHAQLKDRQLESRADGFELALRFGDGSGAVVHTTEVTTSRGTPVEDLGRLLGDRLSTLA